MLRDLQGLNAVERIDTYLFFGTAADHIPSLAEDLYTIGPNFERARLIVPIAAVSDFDGNPVAHGFDNRDQKPLPARDVLEQDAAFQFMTFVKEVIHRKRIEQSRTHSAPVHIFRVIDMVGVFVTLVALDIQIEHLLDGFAVVVERAQRNLLSIHVQLREQPLPVYCLERYFPGTMNCIDQPDITLEQPRGAFL